MRPGHPLSRTKKFLFVDHTSYTMSATAGAQHDARQVADRSRSRPTCRRPGASAASDRHTCSDRGCAAVLRRRGKKQRRRSSKCGAAAAAPPLSSRSPAARQRRAFGCRPDHLQASGDARRANAAFIVFSSGATYRCKGVSCRPWLHLHRMDPTLGFLDAHSRHG